MVIQFLPVRPLFKPLLFILLCLSASPLFAQTVKYKYDALGRMTFVEDATNGNRDFDYDKAGNRLLVSTGTANDPAAEPLPPGSLPAPTGLRCNSIAQGAWNASWTAVAGADHYVFRLGDNYLSAYTSNEPNGAVRITGTSTPVYSVNTSTPPCKWVKACDASNNCGTQANF